MYSNELMILNQWTNVDRIGEWHTEKVTQKNRIGEWYNEKVAPKKPNKWVVHWTGFQNKNQIGERYIVPVTKKKKK